MTRTIRTLDSSNAMMFDGITAAVWQISMTTDVVTPPRLVNIIPGVQYTVIFVQGENPHSFVWPAGCKNPVPIDLKPLSRTTQNFIGYFGNVMLANLPGSWTEETP
jgi:hypothetical protein